MHGRCVAEVAKKQSLKQLNEEDGQLVFIICSEGFVLSYNPQLLQTLIRMCFVGNQRLCSLWLSFLLRLFILYFLRLFFFAY